MSFVSGLEKTAVSLSSLSAAAKSALSEGKGLGAAAIKGLKSSGSETVGSALKLKPLAHIGKAVDQAGGLSKAVGTPEGRKTFAEGLGKSAPGLAAGAGYAYGLKKVYDKALGSQQNSPAYYT